MTSAGTLGPGGDDGMRPNKDGERRKLVRAAGLEEGPEVVPELVETKDRVWGVHDDDINGRAVVTYIVMYVRAHARL